MKHTKTILAVSVISALLSACGGGGGGSAGNSSSGTAVGASASGRMLATDGAEVAALQCSGNVCRLPASANRAQPGSVYQYTNTGALAQTVSISGNPLSSAWQMVVSRVSAGDTSSQAKLGASGLRGGSDAAAERLEAESRAVMAAVGAAARSGALSLRAAGSHRLLAEQAKLQASSYAIGDKRVWHDMDKDSATSLQAMRDLPNGGGKVYVWAQDGLDVSVGSDQADALAERFANSVYPLEASVVSEPWGDDIDPGWRALALPGDTKDVHLVLSRLNDPNQANGSRLLGYVRWTNALLASAAPTMCGADQGCRDVVGKSNQALATFVDLDTFAQADPGRNWSMKGNGPSLALSTLAHEYLHVLYAYNKILRKPPGSGSPTVWENELAAQTMGYLVSADTFTGGRGSDANSHPDLRRGGDFESFLRRPACNLKGWSVAASNYTCYPKALAAGMQMLHQFGAGVMKPWVTGANTGERALNDGLRAAGAGDYGSLMLRLNTTLALGDNPASGYGFPAKTLSLPANQYFPNGKSLLLPAVPFQAQEIGWSALATAETYRQSLPLSRGVARVTVPANSHLILVKP